MIGEGRLTPILRELDLVPCKGKLEKCGCFKVEDVCAKGAAGLNAIGLDKQHAFRIVAACVADRHKRMINASPPDTSLVIPGVGGEDHKQHQSVKSSDDVRDANAVAVVEEQRQRGLPLPDVLVTLTREKLEQGMVFDAQTMRLLDVEKLSLASKSVALHACIGMRLVTVDDIFVHTPDDVQATTAEKGTAVLRFTADSPNKHRQRGVPLPIQPGTQYDEQASGGVAVMLTRSELLRQSGVSWGLQLRCAEDAAAAKRTMQFPVLLGCSSGSVASDCTELLDCVGNALLSVNGNAAYTMEEVAETIEGEECIVLRFGAPPHVDQQEQQEQRAQVAGALDGQGLRRPASATLPAQDFSRYDPSDEWPTAKGGAADGGGREVDGLDGSPERRAARSLLTALCAVFTAAADAAQTAAGWEVHGSGWRLKKPHSPQLLRAAKHFAETKLGSSGADQSQGTGMMGMFMSSDVEIEEEMRPPEGVTLDIDALITQVREERRLPDRDQLKTLCFRARQLLLKEENILQVDVPCTLVGDIHGQFYDLLFQVLPKGGDPANKRYVFLGDFVDRGEHSLLCLALILLYKLRDPSNITLLRGNHESRMTNTIASSSGGWGDPDNDVWSMFNHVFDSMPLAAVVGDRVFCCHGGLSPQLLTLDRILSFDRLRDIAAGPGSMADLTWSDPGESPGWTPNTRGGGHLFGADITKQFCEDNRLSFVCRAHQCVKDGYQWDHGKRIVTVFSAPHYCGQDNKGAILLLDERLDETFVVYDEAERPAEGAALPSAEQLPAYFHTDPAHGEDTSGERQQYQATVVERGTAKHSLLYWITNNIVNNIVDNIVDNPEPSCDASP
eukprot:gene57616-biopygen74080